MAPSLCFPVALPQFSIGAIKRLGISSRARSPCFPSASGRGTVPGYDPTDGTACRSHRYPAAILKSSAEIVKAVKSRVRRTAQRLGIGLTPGTRTELVASGAIIFSASSISLKAAVAELK